MKKILSLILFALLLLPLEGQGILRANAFYTASTVSYPDFCAEYDTVFAAMTTKPSTAIAISQNAMVDSLVQKGYWERMDQLLIPATEVNTGGEALINWINPGTYDADNVDATAWTTLEGYTGDATADYISTNFNPGDGGSYNYTLDDAAIGLYLRTDLKEGSSSVCGALDGTNRISLTPRLQDNQYLIRVNQPTAGSLAGIAGATTGLHVITRTASDAVSYYRNGGLVKTETDASSAIPNMELYVLRMNGSSFASAHQFSIYFVMDGIDSTDAAALNTIFETYMDAIGTGVVE
jgi:hypothetical protein